MNQQGLDVLVACREEINELRAENERLQSDLEAMEIKRNTASVNLVNALKDNERLRTVLRLLVDATYQSEMTWVERIREARRALGEET